MIGAEELNRELRQADPASARRMESLELGPAEADLGAGIVAQPAEERGPEGAPPPWPSASRRRLPGLLGLAGAAAAIVLAVVLLAGGGSESPSKAYGADLVRFAESSPLLLLDGPGWRVQNANEERRREGVEGSMEFVKGRAIPYETITIHADGSQSGMFPPATRQRRVQLNWRHGTLAQWLRSARGFAHPHGQHWIKLPVLGDTEAEVNTRAEGFSNVGGRGDREMLALWSEDGYVLELRAAVPDLAGFEERLEWLTKVDLRSWLEAMPPKVVKAGDHDAAVAEMLKGIPVPATFSPARVPDDGLNTDRYQVGAKVTGTVACLWLRQWGAARRGGDTAAALEAERAMATSRRWPVLREMDRDGDYPEVVWEVAASMPQGYRLWAGHRRRLLPFAEGLGCARMGLPLMPSKMKRQREQGAPPPPR